MPSELLKIPSLFRCTSHKYVIFLEIPDDLTRSQHYMCSLCPRSAPPTSGLEHGNTQQRPALSSGGLWQFTTLSMEVLKTSALECKAVPSGQLRPNSTCHCGLVRTLYTLGCLSSTRTLAPGIIFKLSLSFIYSLSLSLSLSLVWGGVV